MMRKFGSAIITLFQLSSISLLRTSALPAAKSSHTAEFDISTLLGEWHDVMRTTYVWGLDTWPSQTWNFVQGKDGTLIAVFNAWCKSCNACSKTYLLSMERNDAPDGPITFFFRGFGQNFTMWLESSPKTHVVVSICLDTEVPLPADCPETQYQVSVLFRGSDPSPEDIVESMSDLPANVNGLDNSTGEMPCPSVFIDRDLVTAEFAESVSQGIVDTESIVAVNGSKVKLSCTAREDQASEMISWVKAKENKMLRAGKKGIAEDTRLRVRHSTSQPAEWVLRIRDVLPEDAGLYACVTEKNETIARVALSVGVPPNITSKSDDLSIIRGSSVELTCEATGKPDPSISWFYVASNVSGVEAFVADGDTLMIENFTDTSDGRYVCRASNDFPPPADGVISAHLLPEITVQDAEMSAPFGDSAELICEIKTYSLRNAWWRKNGQDVVDDHLHLLDLSSEAAGVFILTLSIRELSRDDFGEYVCFATNRAGSSEAKTTVTETWATGEQCYVENIPVVPSFSIQEFMGSWERMQTTTYVWGNKTYQSEVMGHFITISGSLLQYYRGYDPLTERCLEPGAGSMILLDKAGDYLVPLGKERGRYKVVYTDYTHAVVYFCVSADAQRPCPRDRLHVQIISRLPVIPENKLGVLYRYVQSTCVPVSDLVDTVPGLCRMPPEFVYDRGYIGRFLEPNCQVAKLEVQEGMTPIAVSGAWILVGLVKPQFAPYIMRSSVYIVPQGKDLAIFYRGYDSVRNLCSSPMVDLLHLSGTAGSYYHDYSGLNKRITVDSKFLYASKNSLVLYTCLAVRLDGSCYNGSELVEIYHRSASITDQELLWLKRPLVRACVDIGRLVRPVVGECPVPTRVLTAVDNGLLGNDHTLIGCHHKFINTADGFSEDQFLGSWLTLYRTGYDLQGQEQCSQSEEMCLASKLLGEYSKTTEVVKTADGRLLLLSRYYNSTVWKGCPPTEVLELKQDGQQSDYSFSYTSHKGLLKVLHMDDTTALLYWCHSFDSNGLCRKHSLVVEILARSPDTTIPEDKMHATLNQVIVNVCVDVDDIHPTAREFKCAIPNRVIELAQMGEIVAEYDIPVVTCKGELLQGMPDVDVEKLVGAWNMVWRTEMFSGEVAPKAESSYFVPAYTGLLHIWRSFDNGLERCAPEKAGQYVRTSSAGDYYSGFEGRPVSMKLLYTDNTNLLVFWCHLDNNSECHHDRTSLQILSKKSALDDTAMKELLAYYDDSCLTSKTWMASSSATCSIENDVLTAAYIDGIGLEYSRIGCRKDLILGQRAVTDDVLTGKWRSILWSQYSDTNSPSARVIFHFVKQADEQISVIYRLYNSVKEECFPSILMSLQREGTDLGSFSVGQERVTKILYAEDDILAALICSEFLEDKTCDPQTQIFVVMVRDGSQQELDKALFQKMRVIGADVCIAPESLVEPTVEACPIPDDILRDVTKGELQTDYLPAQCLIQYLPMVEDFDIRDFIGAWFTRWKTERSAPEDSPVGPTSYHFVSQQNGTVYMLFAAENPSAADMCLPTRLQRLELGDRNGDFTFDFHYTQALLKVVWLDDESAVIYWCLETGENGLCRDGQLHLSVLSRQPEEDEDAMPFRLLPTIADCCVSKTDLVNVNSGGCPVPTNIVEALLDDKRTFETPSSVIQCAQEFIPVMENVDVELFSGVWHTVRQTKFMWGNSTWDSLLRSFVLRSDGTLLMAFTGHQRDKVSCVPTEVQTLRSSERPGQWTYTEGETSVVIKVVWTDYASSTLLYTCSKVGDDGLCQKNHLQVEFLSRAPQLQESVEDMMTSMLPLLCVSQREMEYIQTGLCKITAVVEQAVRAGKERPGSGADNSVSCRVQDLPLATNFRFLQITGYWFEIARTRFTFNNMESTISYYEFNPEKENLDGLFIGTLQQQCQSALKSVTKRKYPDGPDSTITGRIQGPESIFPWITFNIIYFDGSFMMHYACYAENPDGTCPRDKTEVTLLGRSRQLSANMEAKLDELMQTLCLSREDLVITKETADCLPMLLAVNKGEKDLPDTAGCPLNDIPAVNNFTEDELLGTWYGQGTVDYGVEGDPTGYVVSISRSTSRTLLWKQWNIKGESCQAEKAIYLKPACHGDKSGDYISTRGSSFMLQWSTMKIFRLEGDLMMVYWCTKETDEGACEPDGVRVDLLGRSRTVSLDAMIPLLDSLSSVCLTPDNMRPVESTGGCDSLASATSSLVELSSCAVDLLPAVYADVDKMSGVWYEMAHTVDPMFPLQKAVVYYKAQPDNQLSMFLVAVGPDGECKGPMEGRMKPHCHSNPDSHYKGRLKFPGMWSWAPWRLLHADYNRTAIALSCMDEQQDGSCSPHGTKLHLLSRDSNPSPALRQRLNDLLRDFGCFDHLPMEEIVHEGASCEDKLNPVMDPGS